MNTDLIDKLYLVLDVNSMNLPDGTRGCGSSEPDVIPRVLYSPGYPNNYENSLNECLNVTPSYGYSKITFMDFHTEEDYDYRYVSWRISMYTVDLH